MEGGENDHRGPSGAAVKEGPKDEEVPVDSFEEDLNPILNKVNGVLEKAVRDLCTKKVKGVHSHYKSRIKDLQKQVARLSSEKEKLASQVKKGASRPAKAYAERDACTQGGGPSSSQPLKVRVSTQNQKASTEDKLRIMQLEHDRIDKTWGALYDNLLRQGVAASDLPEYPSGPTENLGVWFIHKELALQTLQAIPCAKTSQKFTP